MQPGDPSPTTSAPPAGASSSSSSSSSSGFGFGLYALVLLGGAAAYGAYQYLQTTAAAEKQ